MLATAIICLSVPSCKKESLSIQPEQLSIASARNYFETQVKKSSARTETGKILPVTGTPNWEVAIMKKSDIGNTLSIPINTDRLYAVDRNRTFVQGYAYLLIYKDGEGSFQHEVVNVIPTVKNTDTAFNGYAIVQDWSGSILKAFAYENGHHTSQTVSIKNTDNIAIKKEIYCQEIAITTCTYNGIYYDCDHTVAVVCPGGGGGADFPGHPDWGGNPGGPVDPDNYPLSGGTSGGSATNIIVNNILTEFEKANDVIQRGKDPNFLQGATSGHALTKLSLLGMVDYIITFNWDIIGKTPQVTDIHANLTGMTLGLLGFNQFSAAVTDVRYTTELRFVITGEFTYTLFLNGVGTIFRIPITISGAYNAITGDYMLVQSKLK